MFFEQNKTFCISAKRAFNNKKNFMINCVIASKTGKDVFCVLLRGFHSIEYNLYDNMFNLDFLGHIHAQLFDYLEKLLNLKQ